MAGASTQVAEQAQQLELLQSHFDQLRSDFLHNESVLHERDEELTASEQHLRQALEQVQTTHDALAAAHTSHDALHKRHAHLESRCVLTSIQHDGACSYS